MRVVGMAALILSAGIIVAPALAAAQESEEAKITESAPEFLEKSDEIAAALEASILSENLGSSGFGSMPSGEFKALVALMKREAPIAGISTGASGTTYDVVIQPGHYGRQTGTVGTSGVLVSERALVAHIAREVAAGLSNSGLKVLLVPADGVPNGIKTKVFLAIHADGSVNQCKIGPSLAYSPGTSPHSMHAIGFALSRAFGYDYENFMKDNYTAAEAKYYMFEKMNTSIMEGLLEVGELTCADIEKRLIESSSVIGRNVAAAIQYIATTQAAK
jgi:N-acetylmuramoyl-L-alanine amidase